MENPIPPRSLGRLGEQAAEGDLVSRGFEILARNVRLRGVEFDIVARKRSEVWFVEVKTRSSIRGGYPYERIDAAKIARMETGALEFLEGRGLPDADFCLVAASILVEGPEDRPRIEWTPLE